MNRSCSILVISTLAAAAWMLMGCDSLKSYPPTPSIEYKDYRVEELVDADQQKTYKVYLRFLLTDGDGNIGLRPSDTTGIFHSSQKYYYNLFVQMQERRATGYVPEESKAPRHWRIPYLEPQGQNKTLIADFEIAYEFFDQLSVGYDTVRFDFYVADRELNHSDTVSSAKIPFRVPTNGYVKGIH